MKAVISKLEDVAEAFRSEYEPHEGKFRLKLEDQPVGYVKAEDLLNANRKVVEFRDKNIDLLKEVDELRPLKTQFEGIDPVVAREAITKVNALGKKGIKDIDDFNTAVKNTVDDLLKPIKEQLATSAAEVAAERKRADEFLLQSQIADKFTKLGGKPNAVQFVTGLAEQVFEVKDKSVVAKTGKFSADKPGELVSIDEWLGQVSKEHDYVFQPSGGGGTPPRIAGGGGGIVPGALKPGQTILKNPTPQQLGEASADILAGKVKVVNEVVTT